MARILLLTHRLPYPPDKGDKIRSYHLLMHLAARHEVTLATFIDDPADEVHLGAVRSICREAIVARLNPKFARLKSLVALATGEPLTLRYYRDAALLRRVREAARERAFDLAFVFSSSMVPYATALPGTPMLLDLVDVDSAKWAAYAPRHRWPMSWPLAREGRELLAFEREAVARAERSYLCTEQERDLLRSLAPETRGRVDVVRNGVDAEHYSPAPDRPSPFAKDECALVFTGAMDYWPNVDAVSWFVASMLPALRARFPALRFHIVGRSPTPAVRALARDAVVVTGTVPDVRPYLQHAAAVVAPLRVARGIQNKILEAMAMARPVVTARACATALDAVAGTAESSSGAELLCADDEAAYVQAVGALIADSGLAKAIGEAGRRRVLRTYSWQGSLAVLDQHVNQVLAAATRTAAASTPVLEAS